jgi:hypothetical protein
MSTVKKPVVTPVEDFKFITDLFSREENDAAKWVTPESVTTVTTVVSNFLAVLVLVGWLTSADVETLTKAVAAIVGASEVIVVNSVLIWKFVASRTALKTKLMTMKYQYVEAVNVEKVRAL